ncbi:MAG: hypothetical protein A3C36_02260 [Omnitrophica WOR_2 bacterium RIFCSPHIGHO2_02_FULL_52_10]|nr:MAG: hypothetical protein A3C36_02260 [Omnitrophica WOR_2 bacterium RIFCSPHIGHO2_02_FULL_52_10]
MNTRRNWLITCFVILWCLAFHYESVRYFYLEPLAGRPLPKIKFLFPPAGWIMFYRVDRSYGHVRVFGYKGDQGMEIDPHEIFRVRTIGYDNIHRGVIGSAASSHNQAAFCEHLRRRFGDMDSFRIVSTYYPDFVAHPYEQYHQILYSCPEKKRE